MKPPRLPTGPAPRRGVQDMAQAVEAAARRSREVGLLRDRLRRMLDDPKTAEAFARSLRGWIREGD